jgi:hypothetical protein
MKRDASDRQNAAQYPCNAEIADKDSCRIHAAGGPAEGHELHTDIGNAKYGNPARIVAAVSCCRRRADGATSNALMPTMLVNSGATPAIHARAAAVAAWVRAGSESADVRLVK